jgi:superfamily I DNA/RNA helicase
LFAFRTWQEVQDYADNDPAGSDLKVFVNLVDEHGPDLVIDTVDRLADEHDAAVVVSTAHKAKGREWDSVKIAPDFREPKRRDGEDEEPAVPREEAMLAYVAVTRAKLTLDRQGLAWVDRWLPGGDPR